jgi:putative ABC transport system permease protein
MLRNYLITTWKVLQRRKFFTAISLFGISFTLAVLMVVTALVDTLLYPAPAGSRLDRTLIASRVTLTGPLQTTSWSGASYWFLDTYFKSLQSAELVSISSMPKTLFHPLSSQRVTLIYKYTDANFWPICEMEFTEGGPYSEAQVANADLVAVVTDRTALQLFGHEPAVGKTIESGGSMYRVTGVVRESHADIFTLAADVYLPVTTGRFDLTKQEYTGSFIALVTAPAGTDLGILKDETAATLARIQSPHPDRWSVVTCSLGDHLDLLVTEWLGDDQGDNGRRIVLGLISVLMFLFMLLPTINLITINTSRILERSSEIGVRKAFGATPTTLVGQFIVENVVLTLCGGVIAVVLALTVMAVFNASGLVPFLQLGFSLSVFLISLGICLFFGLLSVYTRPIACRVCRPLTLSEEPNHDTSPVRTDLEPQTPEFPADAGNRHRLRGPVRHRRPDRSVPCRVCPAARIQV